MRIGYYAAVPDPALFTDIEFYRQDIEALGSLGHEVVLMHRPAQLLHARCDLYCVWWPTSGMPAVVAATARRRPCVLFCSISENDRSASGLGAKPPWVRQAARASLALAAVTVTPSRDTAEGLRGYRVRHLLVAPHGVDAAHYAPDPSVARERPYAITISQLTRDNVSRKRIVDVVRTGALLRERGVDLDVLIAGRKGDGCEIVQAEIDRLGCGDRVRLLGHVDSHEKLRLLQGAAVALQPSTYEAFGLAAAEAMACGTPVISHAVGAVPEVIADAGVLLDSQAGPAELADAVEAALAASDGAALAARARERVVRFFSIEARRQHLRNALAIATGDAE